MTITLAITNRAFAAKRLTGFAGFAIVTIL